MIKKYNKILIVLLAALSLATVLMFFSDLYLTSQIEKKKIRPFIISYIKKNFNKSVKFNDLYLNLFGNLVLTDFELSHDSDFNTNRSLVQAEEACFDLCFRELFKGNIKIDGVAFNKARFFIHKRYGVGYKKSLKRIFPFLSKLKKPKFDLNAGFTLNIVDSMLNYTQVFENVKLKTTFSSLDCTLFYERNQLTYTAKADITPYKTQKISEGSVIVNGKYSANETSPTNSLFLNLRNFDVSLINEFISENKKKPYILTGGLSTKLNLEFKNNSIISNGEIQASNLSLKSTSGESYKIISNENVNIEVATTIARDFSLIDISRLMIKDDTLAIDLKAHLKKKKKKKQGNQWEKIIFSYTTNKINLSKLSQYIALSPKVQYGGTLQSHFEYLYNDTGKRKKREEDIQVNGELTLSNFSLVKLYGGQETTLVNKGSARISVKKEGVEIRGKGFSKKSHFNLNSDTNISKWYPFKSITTAVLNSDLCEVSLLGDIGKNLFIWIFRESNKDSKRGYEEVYFRSKPLGRFIINNDVNLQIRVKELLFGRRAKLSNCEMDLELKRGTLVNKTFNIQGYDGRYIFNLEALFNRDYPAVKANFSLHGFDCEAFSQALYSEPKFTGTASISAEYEVTAYRLAHIIEHSKTSFNLAIRNGTIQNNSMLRRFEKYLLDSGMGVFDFSTLRLDNASIGFSEYGRKFYIRNTMLDTDLASMRLYGLYEYRKPLSLSLDTILIDSTGKKQRFRMFLGGTAFNPYLSIKKKSKKKLLLFDSH